MEIRGNVIGYSLIKYNDICARERERDTFQHKLGHRNFKQCNYSLQSSIFLYSDKPETSQVHEESFSISRGFLDRATTYPRKAT